MDTRVTSGYAGKVTYVATVGCPIQCVWNWSTVWPDGAAFSVISCFVMSWKSLRMQRIAIPGTDGECAKVEMWIPELLQDMLAR